MKFRASFLLLLIIFAIAVFFRFYQLAEIPPALYPDVAINGNDALSALRNHDFKIFYPENNGREGLFMNIIALSFYVFGPSVWAIKMVAAIFGTLTILGTYLLTKKIFSSFCHSERPRGISRECETQIPDKLGDSSSRYAGLRMTQLLNPEIIALLSAFFLAISFWHVNFSRIGFRAIMVPFFLVWSLYFLFKGLCVSSFPGLAPARPRAGKFLISYFLFLVSGLFFGLGFHTYIAFRVAPLVLVPIFIFSLLEEKKLKKIGYWLIFALGVILAASPLIYHYIQNPADFMGRAGQVSIFSSPNPLNALAQSTLKTLGQFIFAGDFNWRHNLSGEPQIFWPLIPFFLLGLFYLAAQIFKRINYTSHNYPLLATGYLLLTWWAVMLLPSILTSEGLPHALRSIGAIPPSYIFTGLGFYLFISYIHSKLKKYESRLFAYKYVGAGLLVVLLLALAAGQFYQYFIYWGEHPETEGAFTKRFVDEADYLNSLPPEVEKFVIVNEGGTPVPWPNGIPMPAQTIIFLTRSVSPPTQVTYIKPEQISQFPNILISKFPAVILPMKFEQKIFTQLRELFPGSETQIMESEGFSVQKINF